MCCRLVSTRELMWLLARCCSPRCSLQRVSHSAERMPGQAARADLLAQSENWEFCRKHKRGGTTGRPAASRSECGAESKLIAWKDENRLAKPRFRTKFQRRFISRMKAMFSRAKK